MERGLYWLVIRKMIKLKDLLNESANEALKVVGHENVGTKKYDGKAWYWPHDYRHYLRDASFKQRKAVHNAWVKIGVPVKKTKDGEKWLEPKSNQKKKAWTIMKKVLDKGNPHTKDFKYKDYGISMGLNIYNLFDARNELYVYPFIKSFKLFFIGFAIFF